MKKLIFFVSFFLSLEISYSNDIIWMNEGYVQTIIGTSISNDCNYLALSKYGTHGSSIQFWDLANKKKLYQDTIANIPYILVDNNDYLCYLIRNVKYTALIVKDKNQNIITIDTLPYDAYSLKSIPNSSSKLIMMPNGSSTQFSIYDYETHKFEDSINIDLGKDFTQLKDNFIFSPDGKYFVFNCTTSYIQRDSAPYNMVYIYNLQTKEFKCRALQYPSILSMAISEDSKYLITATSNSQSTIAYWDLNLGDTLKTYSYSNIYPFIIKLISSDKLLIYDKYTYKLHYLDLINGTDSIIAELKETCDYGYFTSDSTFISVTGNTIKYWSFSYNNSFIKLDTILNDINTNNHTAFAVGVDISPDNSLIASGGGDEVVKIWNSTSGAFLYNLTTENPSKIGAVRFSHKGDRIAWMARTPENTLVISTLEENNTYHKISNLNFTIYNMDWSPDDKNIAICGDNDSVYVFDSEKGKLIYTLNALSNSSSILTFSPDGTELAVGNWNNLIVWNLSNKQILFQNQVLQTYWISDLDFSKDGNLLAVACADGYTRVFETTNWTVVKELNSKTIYNGYVYIPNMVIQSKFSPDSKRIIGGFRSSFFKVWDYETGNDFKVYDDLRFIDNYIHIRNLALSHDGSFIVSVDENGNVVKWVGWDVTDVKEPQNITNESIYPNPVSDYLFIKNQDIFNSNIQIYNFLGIIVIETNYQNKIDVRDLSPGLYFLRMDERMYMFVKM
jgi:WD40 repeat protein